MHEIEIGCKSELYSSYTCHTCFEAEMAQSRWHISENSQEYRVSLLGYDCVGMRISKHGPEGKRIVELFEEKTFDKVSDVLDEILVKHMTIDILNAMVRNARDDAYEVGKDKVQSDIRKALGIY